MNRIIYIDYLKTLAILLVVAGHVLSWLNVSSESLFQGQITLNNILFRIIYSFHMPLFFFASGFLSQRSLCNAVKGNMIEFVNKKAIQLIVPFLFAGTLLYFCELYPDITNYWYLRSLFEYYLLTAAIIAILNKCKFSENYISSILFVSSLLLIGLVKLTKLKYINEVFDFGSFYLYPFFVFGYLYKKHELKKYLFNPIITFLLYIILFYINNNIFRSIAVQDLCAFAMICTVLAVLCGNYNFNKRNSIVEYISVNTINVYVLHFYFGGIIRLYKVDITNFYYLFIVLSIVIFLTIIISICCLFLSQLLNRFPVISILMFGKKA